MRKRIKSAISFTLILLMFLLSGCKFSVLPADKLIRPPKSGAEIESVIEKITGENIFLQTPSNPASEFKTPLTLIDLDADGTEEAVAFYTTASNDSDVHLNILKHLGDEWISVGDFSGYGNKIETLSFRNLSKDVKQYDIVATWSFIDSKVMTIHKLEGTGRRTKLRSVCNESYSAMSYVDVDKDGIHEIFLVSGDFADKTKVPVAKIIRVDNYGILNVGMISLSRDIISFINSYCQEVNNEKVPMIAVLDYENENKEYCTEVLYWNVKKSALEILRVDSSTNTAFSTARTIPILSTDVNGDTYVDIPVQERIIGSTLDENVYTSALTYTKWCELVVADDGIELKDSGSYRLYFTDKDYFEVSPSLVSDITVARNTNSDLWVVHTYNPDDLNTNVTLLEVRNITQENIESFIASGYKQLSTNTTDSKILVYRITEDGINAGITERNMVNVNL